MNLSLIDILIAPDAPERFCEVRIRADAPLPSSCVVVIERPGQDKAFLATDGWQANYVRLATPIRHDPPAASCLRLSGSLLRFLETGYNYRITLFDDGGAQLGLFVVNWYLPPDLLPPVAPPRSMSAAVTDSTSDKRQPDPANPADELPGTGAAVLLPRPDTARTDQPPRQVKPCGCESQRMVFSTMVTCPFCGRALR
jgi:hypothetical protein